MEEEEKKGNEAEAVPIKRGADVPKLIPIQKPETAESQQGGSDSEGSGGGQDKGGGPDSSNSSSSSDSGTSETK